MIRGVLDAYEPNWRRRLFKYGIKKAFKVAGEYAAWSKILRKPYTTKGEIAGDDKKSFDPKMPPARSRSRGRTKSRGPPTPGQMDISRSRSLVPKRKKTKTAAKKKKVKFALVQGSSGTYQGSFKRAKKRTVNKERLKFETQGVVYRQEYAGVATGSECVYVGHGTPTNSLFDNAMRALVRSLLIRGGLTVVSFTDRLNFAGTVNLIYCKSGGTVNPFATTYTITAGMSCSDIANGLRTQLATDITATDALDSLNFQMIDLRILAGAALINIAEINLNTYKLIFDYSSILKIKNTSLADAEVDGDDASNVEAVCLVGKVYATKQWNNGFNLQRSTGPGAVRNTIFAGIETGDINVSAADIGDIATDNPYNKPPPGYMLGTNKYSTVRMNPGDLKTDVCKWKAKMLFNTYMNKAIFQANTALDAALRQIGSAHMFAFEKEIEIGQGLGAQNIRLAYQVDYSIKVRGVNALGRAPPITKTSQ